jgi:hypothetical protein
MWSVCNGTAIFVRTKSGAAILKRRDDRRDLRFASGDQRHAGTEPTFRNAPKLNDSNKLRLTLGGAFDSPFA